MAELDVIVQPEAYRGSKPPAWAFFHRLRLMLGWGEGVWETLGDQMSRVRTLFVITDPRRPIMNEELESFFEWIDRYDADRPPMPFYARALREFGTECQILHANIICKTYAGPPSHALHGPEAHHPLEANEHFRVAHEVTEERCIALTIQKRSKAFKPELIGEKVAKIVDLKRDYKDKRVAEIVADESSWPPRFLVEMALQDRIRQEEVDRGKLRPDGQPHRPFSYDELVARTAAAIADIEATAMAFDFTWTPAARIDHDGLTFL